MLARDVNSQPTQYRTWVVGTEPDLTAQYYTGYKSGENELVDISVHPVSDSAVMDFNMPNPKSWDTTKKVLPEAISNSQLAIIDGYIYLFGGKNTNKIYRATTKNPATWEDTGKTLPNKLYDSQLAIVNDTVYLFGGIADGYASANIYSASIYDPLTWTNTGYSLPEKISNSQLMVLDGYLYLVGGLSDNEPTNKIFVAGTTNPTFWTTTAFTLPVPLYNSQISILGNRVYLFGGQLSDRSYSSYIFDAPDNDLSSWTASGSLPAPMSNAQFVVVGYDGYLFGPTDAGGVAKYTSIFRCRVTSPHVWYDTGNFIPGEVTSSQLAIIYDRLFLFGGNGSSIIFASNPEYHFHESEARVFEYGYISKTAVKFTPSNLELFKTLGFPYWKTDYLALI